MKFLSVFWLLILLASPVWGQAIDQQTAKFVRDAVIGAQSFSFSTLPASGSLVCATFWGWQQGASLDIQVVSDNQGNTYDLTSSLGSDGVASVACAPNVISSGTFTITITPVDVAEPFYLVAAGISFTSMQSAAPKDRTASDSQPGPQTNDATVTTSPLATTTPNQVVIICAGIFFLDAFVNVTNPGGYTEILSEQDASNHVGGQCAYKTTTSTGVQSAAWSHVDVTTTFPTDTHYTGWAAVLTTWKGVTGVVAGTLPRRGLISQ
jgi:hypothetical protein